MACLNELHGRLCGLVDKTGILEILILDPASDMDLAFGKLLNLYGLKVSLPVKWVILGVVRHN